MLTPEQTTWLEGFRKDAMTLIHSPWLATLYTAIAAVESAYGQRVVGDARGLNEVGYSAVPDRPSIAAIETRSGNPKQFRLFLNRPQELLALEYLAHRSRHYATARAGFVIAFLVSYTGLTDVTEYVHVYNQIANDNIEPVVYPILGRAELTTRPE